MYTDPAKPLTPIMFEKQCPTLLEHTYDNTCSNLVTFHLHEHEELHLKRIQVKTGAQITIDWCTI